MTSARLHRHDLDRRRTLLVALSLVFVTDGFAATGPRFVDVTSASGLTFVHTNGATPTRFMPETMGSGVCLFDADGDGHLDVYLVDGSESGAAGFEPGAPDRLFLGRGSLRFEDATKESGLDDRRFGMGCTVGDIDNDGDADLYVTNFGPNTLWLNDGTGKFAEVGSKRGVDLATWSVSAAFGDLDGDGRIDLYVSSYVDFAFDNHKYCGDLSRGLRAYCHPDVYDGLPHALLINTGDAFRNATAEAGLTSTAGKGLGVILTDLDGDGDLDIYGANDSTINYVYRNDGEGKFKDVSLLSGAGFNENGAAEAGMGVDAGDVDGDGDVDLFVTNLDLETNTLYQAVKPGRFRDVTTRSGLALPSLLKVGFGTNFLDFDNDGDLDLLVVNGHILDNVAEFKDNVTHAQTAQLFANDGRGQFVDVSSSAGTFFTTPIVGRGLAVGDLDDDGDIDAVVTTNGGAAHVLENRSDRGNGVLVELRGVKSNRDGYGARLELTVDDVTIVRECRSASSYLSQGDRRVHFGLGDSDHAQLRVRWPSGAVDTIDRVGASTRIIVVEGEGVVATHDLGKEPDTRPTRSAPTRSEEKR